ncbi:MAG: biopolymer transporter ExbD [Endomicrobium sp.]|jgi:biopolymer transport protein ExbD|nr:biopolymer transporter ExbD [Endomicrobium sp.]
MKVRRKRNTISAEINIAPFTDVVLVLLIIFMVITPALMQPSIKINIPKTEIVDNDNEKNISNIEVFISKEGHVYMDGKYINNANVEKVIQERISSNADIVLLIKGDELVPYDYVIQFIAKAKKARASKFALAFENVSSHKII